MNEPNQITKLSLTMSNITPQINKEARLKQFEAQLKLKTHLAPLIISHLGSSLSNKDTPLDQIRQILFVSERLTCIYKYQPLFNSITEEQVNSLSKYIMLQNDDQSLINAFDLVGNLCMNKRLEVFYKNKMLFMGLLEKFIQISSEQVQWLLTEVIIEMLLSNAHFIPIANNPYYFLQFWLHYINQQPKKEKKLYSIKAINRLYTNPAARQGLFYQSDFKTLSDLLLRVAQECSDSITLRVPLQCYITLCQSKVLDAPHKLGQYLDFLSCLDVDDLKIRDLSDKIHKLGE